MSIPGARLPTSGPPIAGAEPFLTRLARESLTIPADDFAPSMALRLMTVAVMLEFLTPAGHARTSAEISEVAGMSVPQVEFVLRSLTDVDMMVRDQGIDGAAVHRLSVLGVSAHESLQRLMRVMRA